MPPPRLHGELPLSTCLKKRGSWERLNDKRASRIKAVVSGGLRNPDSWPKIQSEMVDTMTRLEAALKPKGRLVSIHPFADFNGRRTRLFLREVLRRLELPPVDLVPTTPVGESTYLAALRAADHLDWEPLANIWKARFEAFPGV